MDKLPPEQRYRVGCRFGTPWLRSRTRVRRKLLPVRGTLLGWYSFLSKRRCRDFTADNAFGIELLQSPNLSTQVTQALRDVGKHFCRINRFRGYFGFVVIPDSIPSVAKEVTDFGKNFLG